MILFEDYNSDNLSYHYGNLGKAENYWNMTSSNRGTGHFGTGTYFVSSERDDSYYNKRPLEIVDFSSYNLFVPSNVAEAHELHYKLKVLNNFYDFLLFDEDVVEDDYYKLDTYTSNKEKAEACEKFLDKYGYSFVYEDKEDYITESIMSDEDIDNLSDEEFYDKYGDMFSELGLDDISLTKPTENETAEYKEDMKYEKYVEFLENEISKVYEEISRGVLNTKNLAKELSDSLNISINEVEDALQVVSNYVASNPERDDDSPSTVLMKELGFDGVDVRQFTKGNGFDCGLDNFKFGSVIYDVKPSTVVTDQV